VFYCRSQKSPWYLTSPKKKDFFPHPYWTRHVNLNIILVSDEQVSPLCHWYIINKSSNYIDQWLWSCIFIRTILTIILQRVTYILILSPIKICLGDSSHTWSCVCLVPSQESWKPGTEVVALYNFKGNSKEDLPFSKREVLMIVKSTRVSTHYTMSHQHTFHSDSCLLNLIALSM